ncbi:MAG: hypothetical protein OXC58_03895 [Acidimicrobiaceae bacterium]|nr:hypothetical protein [Acidimicrobiaceae bacterium]
MVTWRRPFICLWCHHFDQLGPYRDPMEIQCKAYPKGIPEAILDNEVDHREPYEGDGGIQFKSGATGSAIAAEALSVG